MPYRTFPSSNQSNSTRKRVNVTFRTNPSPVVESGKPSSRRCCTVSNPSSTSLGNRTNSTPKSATTSAPIITPKFKRVEYASSLYHLPQSADDYVSLHVFSQLFSCCTSFSCLPFALLFYASFSLKSVVQRGSQRKSSTTNQRGPRPGSNQSQAKATPSPPPLSTSENSDVDPYAFVEDEEITRKEEEEEESAPKLSEFAFTEEDEEDDGIKPWFWTPAREVNKQPQAASRTSQSQNSLSPLNLRTGEIKTNGTTGIKVDNDVKNNFGFIQVKAHEINVHRSTSSGVGDQPVLINSGQKETRILSSLYLPNAVGHLYHWINTDKHRSRNLQLDRRGVSFD
ncbi:hypothetical protein ACTXT7_016618 [Hymenolepis weldensis]